MRLFRGRKGSKARPRRRREPRSSIGPLIPYALASGLGFVVFIIGLMATLRQALVPFLAGVARAWDGFLFDRLGEERADLTTHIVAGVLLLLGAYAFFFGLRKFLRSLASLLSPRPVVGFVDAFRRRQNLSSGPRIVALGGGTGLSTMLRGLKQHSSNITAIVCVSDDGGSSGKLVQELGMIPPGDLRNCLVALSDAEKLMTDLFQHRFTQTAGALSGHSLGNLLLAGLVHQSGGDVDEALKRASEVLNIRGRVVPSTTAHVRLKALMEDGTEMVGETSITNSSLRIRRIYLDPPDAEPHPEALQAIQQADIILVGPGSVYTSVIPNLLVPGMADAIAQADCPKVYICNVMTQAGETESFTAAEHVIAIEANLPRRVFDYVVVNDHLPSHSILERYRVSHQDFVDPDVERIKDMGLRPITGNFMSESDYVRHDPFSVAARIMEIV